MLKHKVYQALMANKHAIMGCDRELLLSTALLCIALSLSSMSLLVIILCAIFFGLAFTLLRIAGRHDLKLRQVYMRYRHYRRNYKGRAHAFAINHSKY